MFVFTAFVVRMIWSCASAVDGKPPKPRAVILAGNVSTRFCSISKTIDSMILNVDAVNAAMGKAKRADLLISNELITELAGLAPVVRAFAMICDAAGVEKVPTISRYTFYLSQLFVQCAPAHADSAMLRTYKAGLLASLKTVRGDQMIKLNWLCFTPVVTLLLFAILVCHQRFGDVFEPKNLPWPIAAAYAIDPRNRTVFADAPLAATVKLRWLKAAEAALSSFISQDYDRRKPVDVVVPP